MFSKVLFLYALSNERNIEIINNSLKNCNH
jgi:hypothetical protein